MRIQHNITALNAANRLKANENTVSKNIAKLSSGYRINSAADDAAGLAVSEKMRKQINGLSQAEDNTKNGISLIQTAEGGLNETSAILQRMNTLAVESANGTYKDSDRQNLQLEVTHLEKEIDRISTSTKFNEISLLDGSLSDGGVSGAASATILGISATQETATKENAAITPTAFTADTNATKTFTVTYEDANGKVNRKSISLTYTQGTGEAMGSIVSDNSSTTTLTGTQVAAGETTKALVAALNNDTDLSAAFTITQPTSNAEGANFESKTGGTNGEHLLSITEAGSSLTTTTTPGANAYQQIANGSLNSSVYKVGSTPTAANVFTVNGQKFAFAEDGTDASKLGNDVDVVFITGTTPSKTATTGDIARMAEQISAKTGLNVAEDNATDGNLNIKSGTTSVNGKALVFQVGAEDVEDQRATLSIDNMNATSLGLASLDVSTQPGAQAAIDIISAASAKVSTERAQLGGLQNELEHTANNLGTMNENLTSAESTIRDVDMTDEYVQYSKNQILSQAANAMLAQANTQPQNVLSLLKG